MAIITNSQDQEEGDGEVAAPSAAKAISRSDADVLAAVLERTGGPLPFLQAAIDVARERSGLFRRDPTAARKVAAMAKAARAQAEAEEKLVAAKEETWKLTEIRRNDETRRAADAERKMEGDAENTAKDGRRAREINYLYSHADRDIEMNLIVIRTSISVIVLTSFTLKNKGVFLLNCGLEPNAENGLDLEKYSWTQELSEVNITVPVPQGIKSMFVVCEIEKNHLKVALKGQTPIIDGLLYQPVNVCDCLWTIEDGKSLSILLSKQNKKEWWASVIRGGPELDIKKVKIMPSRLCDLDMDPETRQALQKSKFEHHRRNMGLPTR